MAMRALLNRVLGLSPAEPESAGSPVLPRPFHTATEEDLYYCYRLFLKREPDRAGWESWRQRLVADRFDVRGLVDAFLYSEEFRQQQAALDEPFLVSLDDFHLFVRRNDFFSGAAIARDRLYEPHVGRELRRFLAPGITFLDIGANVGYFAMMAAALVGESGRVLAFEPNPRNCELMARSIEANGFTNVTVHQCAVAERTQQVIFHTSGPHSTGHIARLDTQSGDGGSHVVEAVALDEFLGEMTRLDLVKLDIEGAEPRAIAGMRALLARYRPIIVTEYCPELIREIGEREPEEYLRELAHLGYAFHVVAPDAPLSHQPESIDEISARMTRSNASHLDLVAIPAEKKDALSGSASSS